jgi:hypothetical protein
VSAVPAGWPKAVPPADSEGWVDRAVGWLLDQAPADYRTYPVLRRQPVVLGWLVAQHVDGMVDTTRAAYRVARQDLGEHGVPVPEVLELLETEGARLLALQRSVHLVADALGGRRFVPRL